MKKALFFSPFSFIWEHALPELALMKSLAKDNYKVGFIRCDRVFSDFCICMNSVSLDLNAAKSEKEKICGKCIKNASLIASAPSLISFSLAKYLTPEDRAFVDSVDSQVVFEKGHTYNYSYEGINFSNICLYEII